MRNLFSVFEDLRAGAEDYRERANADLGLTE
jgi:hypothetical protein